jgi:hypothetical protein
MQALFADLEARDARDMHRAAALKPAEDALQLDNSTDDRRSRATGAGLVAARQPLRPPHKAEHWVRTPHSRLFHAHWCCGLQPLTRG